MAEAVSVSAELATNADKLATRGRGILACDESVGTIGKRLVAAGLTNDAETRRAWRDCLLSADNAGSLSGAILFHETLMQSTSDGIPFPELLASKGVLVGIKVDLGLKPLASSPEETYTAGLDSLGERCREYYSKGARFAKWRAALKIDVGKGFPSEAAISANSRDLALYAKIAQNAGLVPLVEPEILIDGSHGIEISSAVAKKVISACYAALRQEGVSLEATLLKPMMIMPGLSNPDKARVTREQVARATLDCMREVVPTEVAGIMFLSGGMSEVQATENLNAINILGDAEGAPWTLSFSYGRALQSSVMKAWSGKKENSLAARAIAGALASVNSQAQLGSYNSANGHPSLMEASGSLYEGFRGHRTGEDPKGS